ncbi:MAG TPA: histidine kinase, partial [Flavisolibacter sp.]|nr:histidine kinase [Flavisolibacter sp.]
MSIQIRKASFLLLLAFLLFQPWLVAQQYNSTEARIDSLNKAFSNYFSSDLAKAEKLATEALDLAVQAGYAFGEASARSNLSAYYLKKENYTKSIEAGLAALKIFDTKEKYKNTFEYGNTFIRLAKSFFMEKDYTRSKAYGHQAIVVAEKIRDQHLLALGYEHLGNNFSMSLDVDSTLYYYNKARKDFLRTNYIPGLANVANNTGAMYSDKGDHQEAIKYFREALAVYQKNNINASLTTGHYNIGFTYHALKSYNNALHFADSAAYYAQQFKRPTSLLKAYILKAQAYAGVGNVDSSASYYEKSLALKDSIQSDTYQKELASLQTQSDIYKKETENQLLAKDKRIAVLYRNLAIAGIIGLGILLGFILLNQRLRIQRRVRDKLEEEVALRTKEIAHQKETIFHTNLRLKLALNGAKFDSQFVTNMLTAIQQVVIQGSAQEAQAYLYKLSQVMQYILKKSPLERVPLAEEIGMAEHYIQLEQLRLNHCFDYN